MNANDIFWAGAGCCIYRGHAWPSDAGHAWLSSGVGLFWSRSEWSSHSVGHLLMSLWKFESWKCEFRKSHGRWMTWHATHIAWNEDNFKSVIQISSLVCITDVNCSRKHYQKQWLYMQTTLPKGSRLSMVCRYRMHAKNLVYQWVACADSVAKRVWFINDLQVQKVLPKD